MGPWVIPAIMGAVQLGGQLIKGHQDKKRQREMNEYNSPASQMKRYQEAGLNPNLIYGQGTPGNQTAPVPTPDFGRVAEAIPLYNQTRMVDSQVTAQNANAAKALAQTELTKIQQQVAKANPLINGDYLQSLIDSMKMSAQIKAAQSSMEMTKADWFSGAKSWMVDGKETHGPAGALKMETELNLLLQKYDLGKADKAIKAEVLNSKEFQNDILEVQKKFMTDGDITPQHILSFIQLFLMKLL